MAKIKILIISNSYIVSSGLQAVLNEIAEIKYFTTEYRANSITDKINSYQPDIVILASSVFDEQELFIKENKISCIEIGYSKNTNLKYFINLQNDDKSSVISLIRKVILENFNKKTQVKSDELSSREISIVKLIAQGLTNQEIADELFLSKHTVITHRKNITNKLNIKTVSGLTVYAILNNILDIKEVK